MHDWLFRYPVVVPANGGRWQLLGEFDLDPATAAYVEVSGRNGQASADAVRFTLLDGAPE